VSGTAILAIIAGVLIFGQIHEADDREPIRWCLIWVFLPIAPFIAGSLLLRPLFAVRYLLPAAPALTLVAAEILNRAGARVRNLATAVAATAFVVVFVQSQPKRYQPWREISERVAKSMPAEPVFFESGLAINHERAGGARSKQFPLGYFRPAFDYYFKGPNPRIAFDPSDPVVARETIARSVGAAGGAWLLRCKGDVLARAELPSAASFTIEPVLPYQYGWLYHIVPRNAPNTVAPTAFDHLSRK
jgi:4-amino-4-deoxy-L-arabinose transferase-like glycosyltransferase